MKLKKDGWIMTCFSASDYLRSVVKMGKIEGFDGYICFRLLIPSAKIREKAGTSKFFVNYF